MSASKGKHDLTNAEAYTPAQDADTEKRRGVSLFARVALAAVVVVSLIISVSSIMRFNELEELQAEIEHCNDDISEKQQLLNAPVDRDYIARMARERLGLHFPDENVYYSRTNGKR